MTTELDASHGHGEPGAPTAWAPAWQRRILPASWRGRGWSLRALLVWAGIAVTTLAGGTVFENWGLPAPHLLVGLVVGLVVAVSGLARWSGLVLPRLVNLSAQAIAGVLLGTYFSIAALRQVGVALIPLLAITLVTVAISVVAGLVVARTTPLDRPTATLGLIAGGSAGVIVAAEDLDADARVVAVLQYVRLILVVATAPVLVRFVLAPHHGEYAAVGAREIEAVASLHGYAWTLGLAAIGVAAGRWTRIPAAALMVPLLLTAAGGALRLYNDLQPPETVREPAFIIIGLAVGLGFDAIVLRRVARAAPVAIAAIFAIVVTCAGLAALLAATTRISLLDSYLATTPGGINAVLVTAFASGANTSLVFAVQGVRLILMVLAAPLLVRWLLTRESRDH